MNDNPGGTGRELVSNPQKAELTDIINKMKQGNPPATEGEIAKVIKDHKAKEPEVTNLDELPSKDPKAIGAWQNFKNNLSNSGEMGWDVVEFWDTTLTGGDEIEQRAEDGTLGAYSGLDIATTMVWEGVFGREKMKEWKEENPNFFSSFNPSDSETFTKVIDAFAEEKEETKETMTFKEADSLGDYVSVATGAVVNVGGSVVYNLGTLGAGFFMEFASDNFIEANTINAEKKGVELEELLQTGDFDIATPVKIAAVQAGLELFSLSKMTKPFGKNVVSELGKSLTKKIAYNKTARIGLDILGTGSTEAVTEMTQYGLEYYNAEVARDENVNMAYTIGEGMFSEQGVEQGLQGLFGGSGLRASARGGKTLSQIRKSSDDLDVESDLKNLVKLRRKFNESKDEDVKAGLEEKILNLEINVNDKIKKGNQIYDKLDQASMSEIEDLGSLADIAAARATELNKKLAKGQISKKDHAIALEGLTEKFTKNRAKIQATINKATGADNGTTKKSAGAGKEGVTDKVFESNLEFAKKHSSLYGLEVDDSLTVDQIREQHGEEAAASDGFIVGDKIIINKTVARATGAVNVGNHELLHGILRKALKNKDISKTVISELKAEVGSQWSAVERRAALYTPEYMEANPDEWITLASDAIQNGDITYNESVFERIGNVIKPILRAAGFKKIKFDTGKDVYSFLKEYNRSIHNGALATDIVKATQEADKDSFKEIQKRGKAQEAAARKDGIKKSLTPDQKKAAVNVKESTRKIVAKNEQIYQRIVDAAKAKGVKVSKDLVTQEMKDELVENNLARASALSNKAARVARNLTLDEGLKIDDASDWFQEYSLKLAELANTWDPSKNDSFGAYMNQLLPKKYSGILEGLKSDLETSSMDTNEGTRAKAEAIAVEDDAAPRSDTRRKKTNVLKIGNIEGKADTIKDAVEVNEGDTFKEVSDNNTGKVAEIIFDVPADKITDPKKNLTYAKRIVDGIPEPSEAGNIQSFYIAPQTVEKLLKILPEESVSSDTADINEIGENIDVDREVLGRGLGLSNRVLNSFYEKTNKRSKGKKSQPFIWKLKPEFKNPTAETIAKVQEDLGITPRGKLNNYNRDIGQLLKGVAKFQAQQTALSTAQRILTEQKAPKKQIASVTAAQSKVAFSKSPLEYSLELKRVAALTPAALLKDLDRSNHATFIREPYISKTTGKLKQRKVADFAREMRVNGVLSDLGKQTMEVLVTFAENYPQYLSDLRTTMSGGQGISFFGLTSVFDKMAAGLKSTSKTFKRSLGGYSVTGSKKLNANKVFKKDGKLVLKEGRKLLSEQTFAEQESKKLDALELFFMHVQQHLKKYPDHAWFFARLITDTGSNMSALTRVAAPVRAFPMTLQKVWDLMYSEVIIEEHSFPQNNVGTMLLNAAIKGESIKDVMKVVRGAYMQMALLETHDNQVTAAGYKFKMPDVFWNEIAPRLKEGSLKIKNGLASVVRYTESGIDLNNYYVPGEGQSITEYFGVGRYNNASETLVNKQNELITKQLTGEITKKEATSIINDFVKVEAIIESSKNRSTEVIDKAFKASRSSTKKLIDGLAENDISDAVSGVNPDGYSDIRFSKSHRAEYEKRLLKKNADIGTAKEAAAHIDALFNWVDSSEVPAKKKSKFEKLALHYMANNKLRMPEDGYKVIEAERLAEAKKIDPFSFKNPNDIIEKYSGEVTKKNPNPDQHLKENDNIGAFSNKREIGNGITVYDVKNGYPGMFATRNMVNEHFGKKSNPWCITQAVDGEITPTAKEYWDQYGTKQILFKDGKLLAMRTESIEGALTDAGDIEFWSRENVRFNEIPGNNYVDKQGREIRSSFNEKTGEDSGIIYGATKGSIESGKLEIYDTYTSEGHYHPQKARYLGDGVKVQLYLDQVERYNKKGQLHGTQEQHTNPVSLEREGYASSITLTKEYKNGDFIGSRTDYGDGQGLGSFQEKLDSRLQKLGDDRAAQREGNIMFSKRGKPTPDSTDLDLNVVLEQTKGVNRNKEFSAAKARKRGKGKGRFKFFVPPSADDFAGLMYAFMGKGKQGEKHHKFFKENLFDPFSKGIRNLNIVKQTVANDLRQLRKAMPDVRKKLDKTVPGTEYTHEDAIRVYNWTQSGFDIPGLSETDKQMLVKVVENDASLNAFAQGVNSISNTPGGMVDPGNHWLGGNIALDLKEALDVARSTHLQQWKDNKDIMFNEANMNKIEAIYGSNFREALEDSLYRMEHGGNRSRGSGRLLNNFTNWIHGSIGTTMFLNARSAMLQMISNVNFVNWSDNNMVAAAGAFANQKQYWGDVSMIFNSPFLKQRRSGIQTDVNASELLAQIKDSKNQVKAATAYLLQLGFTPTQIADSFAIATGGATFYRNRMKTYLKEGMTQAEAETKAFEDMMEIAEETQQSTREDKISQQQASPLGKFILAFQNTPMQYNRLIKKASLDLVNGRGDPKANISRIVYYGGIQNLIFYGLQSALFAALFSDDEEDQITDKKKERVMNGMVDTLLRGSGIGGAIVATVKNVIIKFMKEEEKEKDDNFMTQADHANTLIAALNISPPIGIKARKLYGASQTLDFNRDVIDHMSKTDIDNPIYDAVSSAVQAVTNLPLNRLYNKYQNISEALNSDNEMWQRIAMFLGWNKWDFGIENQDVVAAEGKVKEIKAVEAEERREMKKRAKDVERQAEEEEVIESNLLEQDEEREEGQEDIKCAAVSRSGSRCGKKVKDGGNYCTIHENAPQRANGEKTQCSHVKPNGDRCKMKTANQSGKCYYHD